MTQPIQTTAAIAHLRRVADALRDPRYPEPTESLIADLIEHQARRIEAMRAALEYVVSLRTGGMIEARCRQALADAINEAREMGSGVPR